MCPAGGRQLPPAKQPPFVRNEAKKSCGIHLTGVFDSELDGKIVGTITNGANGVVHEAFFGLLSLFSKKTVRGDEHNLQRHGTRRCQVRAAITSAMKLQATTLWCSFQNIHEYSCSVLSCLAVSNRQTKAATRWKQVEENPSNRPCRTSGCSCEEYSRISIPGKQKQAVENPLSPSTSR